MARYLQPLWRLESLTASLLRVPNLQIVSNITVKQNTKTTLFEMKFLNDKFKYNSNAIFKIDDEDVFNITTSLHVNSEFNFGKSEIKESLHFSSASHTTEYTYFIDVDSDKIFTLGNLDKDFNKIKPNIGINLVSHSSRKKIYEINNLINKITK